MRIGFIGAGNLAQTFGKHLATAGHQVVVSNRKGVESLREIVAAIGPNASAGNKQEAVDCDVVILATLWVHVPEALKGVDWDGRILVDATNAHMDAEPDISLEGVTKSMAALDGRNSTRMVAEMAPGARIVKAISNMPMAWIQDYSAEKPKTVIFVSGDDADAKRTMVGLINGLGFVAVDLGSLEIGAAITQVGGPLSGLHFHFVQRLR